MTGRRYADAAGDASETYRQLWERLGRLPGVTAAGGVSALPLSQMIAWGPITVEGRTPPPGETLHQRRSAHRRRRLFPRDGDPAAAAAGSSPSRTRRPTRAWSSIDEHMARQLWPNGDAIGKRIRTGGIDASANAPWLTVVGVVGRVKQYTLDARLAHGDLLCRTAQITPRR